MRVCAYQMYISISRCKLMGINVQFVYQMYRMLIVFLKTHLLDPETFHWVSLVQANDTVFKCISNVFKCIKCIQMVI